MQHGTGREYVSDIIENVQAVLVGEKERKGWPVNDLISALQRALDALEDQADLDEAGVYGPDHSPPPGPVRPCPDCGEEMGEDGVPCSQAREEYEKWRREGLGLDAPRARGPVGSIRDTRPEGLGR
jgi:hypothetical protein